MYCSQCGSLLRPSDQFCPRCLTDLRDSGAIRMTPIMSDEEIARVMPDELQETAIRPPLPDLEPVRPPASQPTPSSQPTPVRVDDADQGPRLEAARRHVLAARSRQHTRRNQIAVAVLAVALLVAIVPIVIVSWSFFNLGNEVAPSPAPTSAAPSQQQSASASVAPATRATSKAPVSQKPTPSQSPTPSATRTPWPAYASPCSADVAVNADTSCAFALVVAQQVDPTSTAPFQVTATSPVTKQTYTLNCSRPDFIVCTGGRSVRILIQAH